MPKKISDFHDPLLEAAHKRVFSIADKIERTRHMIMSGKPNSPETEERLKGFRRREAALAATSATAFPPNVTGDQVGFESVIGLSNDILSIEFLEIGTIASRSVGKITNGYGENGTGFLVGPGILLTNQHVLQDDIALADTSIVFDFEEQKHSPRRFQKTFMLDSNKFHLEDEGLDYALIAIGDPFDDEPPIENFGWHALIERQNKIRIGDPVNIIQHPRGKEQAIVVHDSYLLHLDNSSEDHMYLWYSGDTEVGSSGSPVFNNRWEVVGLHHKAVPKTNSKNEVLDVNGKTMREERFEDEPEKRVYIANEAIRTSRLVKSIQGKSIADPTKQKIRDDLIALWSETGAHRKGLKAMRLD